MLTYNNIIKLYSETLLHNHYENTKTTETKYLRNNKNLLTENNKNILRNNKDASILKQ